MRIATYHHMKAILQRQFLFWVFLIWNTAISFFVLGWWICQYCWDLHQYNPLKRPREKTEQFPQPIPTYIDIPTFFFWHDHRRTFNGLDLDFWNDSCNANNIFFWKSKSWFASLPPHNRLWWQKWALWKSLLLLMMVMAIEGGGNLSLDYGGEAINSQNFRQTSKPLFQKTLKPLFKRFPH